MASNFYIVHHEFRAGTSSKWWETAYAAIKATDFDNLPAGTMWFVQNCKATAGTAQNSGSPAEVNILENSGTCGNKYLDMTRDIQSVAKAIGTEWGFSFKAFNFASNTAADSITMTCDITVGFDDTVTVGDTSTYDTTLVWKTSYDCANDADMDSL